MRDTFESSACLMKLWQTINRDAFGGGLPVIADIGWLNLESDPDTADLYGGYAPGPNAIGITHELQRMEEVSRELDRLKALGSAGRDQLNLYQNESKPLISAVLGLVAHETAHQATHCYGDSANSHGEAFTRNANRIAQALNLPLVDMTSAEVWPNVLPLILQERQRSSEKDSNP